MLLKRRIGVGVNLGQTTLVRPEPQEMRHCGESCRGFVSVKAKVAGALIARASLVLHRTPPTREQFALVVVRILWLH